MIEFIEGIPGSGKSYKGVFSIYNTFFTDKKLYENQNFYTNIAEFKFDKFDKNIAFVFDFDAFYKVISQLYVLYSSNVGDYELRKLAADLNILNTLFVLDECHNFFGNEDAILVWWLTYHRHFDHNIILITQNLSLVNAKYKNLAETYYKAIPTSRRFSFSFSKKFVYRHYASSRKTKADDLGLINIDFKPEIMDLYQSGASVKTKNQVLRFIIIALAALFVAFVAIKYAMHVIAPNSDSNTTSNTSLSPTSSQLIIANGTRDIYCDNLDCSDGRLFSEIDQNQIISVNHVPGCPQIRIYTLRN